MEELFVPEHPGVCLVTDDAEISDELRTACPERCRIEAYPLSGLLDMAGSATRRLTKIEKAASILDVVLIQWDLQKAPSIGALAYRIRTVPAPLIALVGVDVSDSVAALVVGVDHVHPRPISFPLLRAQILAHLRTLVTSSLSESRRIGGPALTEKPDTEADDGVRRLELGPLALDPKQYRFFVRGEAVKLTPRQFGLIKFLMERRDRLVTRDEILEAVWDIEFDTATNLVDVYIHFLRHLLRTHESAASIETIRGKGYRLSIPQE